MRGFVCFWAGEPLRFSGLVGQGDEGFDKVSDEGKEEGGAKSDAVVGDANDFEVCNLMGLNEFRALPSNGEGC